MPTLKFTEVITFSSEDPNHPADNLLKADTYRKWKCSAALTDKQPTVTLKLEKLSSIRALDIGNEGSAFVEVLVSREGLTNFEVLLVASSFMSPQEARNATNLSRVRMFGPEKLNKNVSSQKWDRIKVVCTQPFNKNIQFGLSFITVQGDETTTSGGNPGIKLGAFTLKPEEDESKTSISIGSIFARMKEKGSESSPSGAAAIRAAGAAAATKRKVDDVNAPDVGFYQLKKKPAEDRDVPSSKTTNGASTSLASKGENANGVISSSKPKHVDKEKKNESSNKEVYKKKKEDRTSRGESHDKKAKKRPVSPSATPSSARLSPTEPKKRKTRPFSGLMKDVVFVMSGYQNPQRGDLRDKMVEMGAKYKPDWDPKCTHLICAFTNTPKYQQVKGKGKIVSAKWIDECHKKKIRYPWRRYQLEKNRNDLESEDEIWADEIVPKSELPEEERREASTSQANSQEKSHKEEEEEDCKEDTDYSDNVDTDDEIERILAKQKHHQKVDDSNSRRNDAEDDENKTDCRARSDRSPDSQENYYIKHKGESHKKKRDSHEIEESHRKTKLQNSELKDKNHNVNREKHETKERSQSKENLRNVSREERHKHKKKDKHAHEENEKSEKESGSKDHTSNVDFDVKQEVKEEIMDIMSADEKGYEESKDTEGVTEEVNGPDLKEESEGEVYEEDTDVDEENKLYLKPDTSSLHLPELGDYLKNKHYFFYGEMTKEKRNLLQRYIVAFEGTVEDYMNEAVQFVITECEWDDSFDEALSENPNLQFVKPQWIWRCSDKKKLVPHQPFLIVPKDC